MTTYDPKVIQKFVDRLYARAASIVATYTVVGGLLGAAGGYFLGLAAKAGGSPVGPVVLGLICAVVGYAIGSERAFQLRLQAQTALCQVKIEENTRASAGAHAGQSDQATVARA